MTDMKRLGRLFEGFTISQIQHRNTNISPISGLFFFFFGALFLTSRGILAVEPSVALYFSILKSQSLKSWLADRLSLTKRNLE